MLVVEEMGLGAPVITGGADAGAGVLIVDDEPSICRLLATVLRLEGVDSYTAGDAETALDSVHSRLPAAVLSDVMLPGMDGVELVHRIKALTGGRLPVFLMSCNPQPMSHEADAFFAKPLDLDAVISRVAGAASPAGAGGSS